MATELDDALVRGLRELGLEFDTGVPDRLVGFVTLLAKWNKTYNLTAVRQPEEMVTRHLLDSLAVAPFLEGRVVDVGTGAGLPGIPLAMICPDQSFLLLDSSAKKIRFVRHAVAKLELANIEVFCGRVQDYDGSAGFDTVISRAFAAAADFVGAAGHLCARGGQLLAMKGAIDRAEIENLPTDWLLAGCHRLDVPGLRAERHLWVLRRNRQDGDR